MTDAMFDTIDQEKLVDRAEGQLLKRILDGTLVQGQRVVEADVARKMGISRAPLREAIRKLESRGLLINIARKGVFVRSYSAAEVVHIANFRLCLEQFAVETLAKNADAEIIRKLNALEATYAAVFANPELQQILDANLAFHQGLIDLVGNPRLSGSFNHLSTELRLIHSLSGAAIDEQFLNPTTYSALIEAIRGRRSAAARAEMARLIAGFRRKGIERSRSIEDE